MFGHQDDQSQKDEDQVANHEIEAVNDPTISDIDQPSGAPQQPWQHPGAPLEHPTEDVTLAARPKEELVIAPPGAPSTPSTPTEDNLPDSSTPAEDNSADELLDIKQQALGQLSPLVGHLDQSPEEKFRTTMMMIQASDDISLVRSAYESAQQIEDEKTRAQALLDIVNEINYFTQHNN